MDALLEFLKPAFNFTFMQYCFIGAGIFVMGLSKGGIGGANICIMCSPHSSCSATFTGYSGCFALITCDGHFRAESILEI